MEEYDNMAQKYILQMTERHAASLLEFQIKLREELSTKPPKWSKELLENRRMQHINARNKAYAQAQKLKQRADEEEERERREMGAGQGLVRSPSSLCRAFVLFLDRFLLVARRPFVSNNRQSFKHS